MVDKSAQAIQEAHVMEGMVNKTEEDQMIEVETVKNLVTEEEETHMVAVVDGNAKLKGF